MKQLKELMSIIFTILILVLTVIIVGYCFYHYYSTECKPDLNSTEDPVLMQCNNGNSFYLERKYL